MQQLMSYRRKELAAACIVCCMWTSSWHCINRTRQQTIFVVGTRQVVWVVGLYWRDFEMNLILLDSADQTILSNEQAEHVKKVLKSKPGDSLRVGIVNGGCGTAEVVEVGSEVEIRLQTDATTLTTCPATDTKVVDVLLGIPRPRVLDRTLQTLATLGVGRVFLVASQRSDKSYLSSPKLRSEGISKSLRTGLEQSGVDTMLPEVYVYASWSRCIRELKSRNFLPPSVKLLVAHPYEEDMTTWYPNVERAGLLEHPGGVLLAIGPEGGFVPPEMKDLDSLGAVGFGLGSRILKVEQAAISAHQLVTHFLCESPQRSLPASRLHSLGPGTVQLPERDWKAQLEGLKTAWDVEKAAKAPKVTRFNL